MIPNLIHFDFDFNQILDIDFDDPCELSEHLVYLWKEIKMFVKEHGNGVDQIIASPEICETLLDVATWDSDKIILSESCKAWIYPSKMLKPGGMVLVGPTTIVVEIKNFKWK